MQVSSNVMSHWSQGNTQDISRKLGRADNFLVMINFQYLIAITHKCLLGDINKTCDI